MHDGPMFALSTTVSSIRADWNSYSSCPPHVQTCDARLGIGGFSKYLTKAWMGYRITSLPGLLWRRVYVSLLSN